MNWVHTFAIVVHVLLAASIIALVLLQRGRGADAGAGFGAGASGTVFGARGSASFLSRMTATVAALFFVTSLALAYLGSQRSAPVSVLDTAPVSRPGSLQLPETPVQGTSGTEGELPPAAIAEPDSVVPDQPEVQTPPAGSGAESAPEAVEPEEPTN